jgi:predicted RNA-binding Zn ribbon-like protein
MRGRRPDAAGLERLNAEIGACRLQEALTLQGTRFGWEWRDPSRALEAPLWPVARAAADLLTSEDTTLLRQCDGEGCGWLFLDRSRNRRRRWCTMEDCGNLDKVRRFRRRHPRRARGR